MSKAKSAKGTLDLAKLAISLKLRPETTQSLGTFRKRHEELIRMVGELEESKQTIDFESYRRLLKNKRIVDEAEKVFGAFQPSVFNKDAQMKVIKAFEAKALEKAAETERALNAQLKDLKEALVNMKETRPVEQLTMEDIVQAVPSIEEKVEEDSRNHKWYNQEFHTKFGNWSFL